MKAAWKEIVAAGVLAALGFGCGGDTDVEFGTQTQALQSGRYIVKYSSPNGRAAAAQAGSVVLDLANRGAVAIEMPEAAAQALANAPGVEFVELDQIRAPSAEVTPYGVPMVLGDAAASGLPSGGSRVNVCIIDSGLATNHADFAGVPVAGALDSDDGCGHGTHVAGTIAAVANDFGVVGVAPDAVELSIVKVFGGTDCGWVYSSGLVAALDECIAHGADVVSMSLGGDLKSRFEEVAFADAHLNNGLLSIAAAGNAGNTRKSYPASYPHVMSVAAIDSAKNVADFSQKNSAVEIAAPGVAVLSTVPWINDNHVKASDGLDIEGNHFGGSGTTAGLLADLAAPTDALCGSTDAGVAGKIALCERGTHSFEDKIRNMVDSGAAGVIVFNSADGPFEGTIGTYTTTVPALAIAGVDGRNLRDNYMGQNLEFVVNGQQVGDGHASWDGTSMATPHVSAVAALIWSYDPSWTNDQIREALTATAEDLGAAGRDDAYGHGLVNAGAALTYLQNGPSCTPTQSSESSCTDSVDNDCDGAVDAADSDCGPDVCSPTEDTETSCNDGIDNDCDGLTDGKGRNADPDCQSDTGGGGSCDLAQKGDACDADSKCCSNKCKGGFCR